MATTHMETLVIMRDGHNLEIVNVCDSYDKRSDAGVVKA